VSLFAAVAAAQEETPGDGLEEQVERIAEERDAQAPLGLPVITVTATRTQRDVFELPQSVTIVTRDEIQDSGNFVAMKAISRRSAAIWYDERTFTTTDPIIRGFAGFNLLALVDGNTLSTLWGEGGFGADDMYGKVDPEVVERIEVIRGPASALYGSNALGAVMNLITRDSPIDYTEDGHEWGGRYKFDYASAPVAWGARAEVFGATDEFKYLLGGSARDFDNVKGGGNLGRLDPSDGRERNWDFAGEMRVAPGKFVRLTVQDVHREDIKRYYRPTQDNVNDRKAVGLFFRDEAGSDLWDWLEGRLYYQYKRDERRFFDTNEKAYAETTTWQGGLQITRDVGSGHVLTGGIQIERDYGDSPDDEQFTFYFPSPKRRDAPLSTWWDYGAYLQDEWQVDPQWSVVGSARCDYQIFKTRVDDKYVPPAGDPRDDDIRDTVTAVTGGLGVVYAPTPPVRLRANWSRGFRQNAPNFGLRQLGDGVLIPNDFLDPTTSDNFEVGVRARQPGWSIDVAYYHSFIDNWQGDFRTTTYKGQPWFDFDGDGSRGLNEGFVKQVEGEDAYVRGLEAHATLHPNAFWDAIPPHWSLWGSFAWNTGKSDPTDENPHHEPLRHTQPTRGLIGVRWDQVDHPELGLFAELVADMVDRYDDIPSDRQDSDVAWRDDPQDDGSPFLRDYVGTPGYTVLNLYAGVNLNDSMRLRAGVENLTDKKYRVAHSRMDAPGINFVASLEITF
jgi:outer membrane receptor protein involved in Fe transport